MQGVVKRDESQDAVFEVKVAPGVTFPELEVFNKARRRRNDRGRGAGIAGLLAVFLAITAGGEYGKAAGVGESYSAKSTLSAWHTIGAVPASAAAKTVSATRATKARSTSRGKERGIWTGEEADEDDDAWKAEGCGERQLGSQFSIYRIHRQIVWG